MTLIARRRLMQTLAITGAFCLLCTNLIGTPAGADTASGYAGPDWSYEDARGPEHWGELSPEFKVCELGFEQTPVDLRSGILSQLAGVVPNFRPMPLKIVNNGHTVQVNCAPDSHFLIDGQAFDLLQFHFHHPSEHQLSRRNFDLEPHFVHQSAAGQLAVLGVFFSAGAENPGLESIFAAMPPQAEPETDTGQMIVLEALLPVDRSFFRYQGSLTTPPCSEGVLWIAFREPVEAGPTQIRQYADIFPTNARPVESFMYRRPRRRKCFEYDDARRVRSCIRPVHAVNS